MVKYSSKEGGFRAATDYTGTTEGYSLSGTDGRATDRMNRDARREFSQCYSLFSRSRSLKSYAV
ncbi:hypothetical protein ZHAS_00018792 [Anopheles sinensis]|uniref:Uncharacterized protein n=1 Tax=Anopheles sinensis TaxID=74873 RepID=A0A084WKK2_ANOSI|nr:hypothetical protein ZHAS_00018792 [Anopheles sinensis]